MSLRFALPLALLALASFASAETEVTLTATISPLVTLSDAVFAYAYDSSTLFGPGAISINYLPLTDGSKNIPGGSDTAVSHTFTNFFDLPIIGYTVFGVYDTGSATGASVAYEPAMASGLLGTDWPYTGAATEDRFVGAFRPFLNADTFDAALRQMVARGELPAVGADASLVNFSAGTPGGSVTNVAFTPVPEPGAFLALGLGALATLRRRR